MADIRDKEENINEQYKDSKNLNTRFYLHDKYSTNKTGFLNWMFEHLAIKNDYKVLELGCGAGHLWSINIDKFNVNSEIILSDISRGMIEETKTRVAGELGYIMMKS